MNISGVLVRAHPEEAKQVGHRIGALSGMEVHTISDDGRIIVTVERDSDGESADAIQQLTDLPGVLSANMVYHQFESDPDQEV